MVKPKEINASGKVIVRQKECTTKPPFNPKPLTVKQTIGNQVHAIKKDGTVKVRDKNQPKKVKERPQYLCPTWEKSVSRSSADYFNFDIEGSFVTETGLDSSEETQGEVPISEQLFSFANNEESEHVIPGQSTIEPEPAMNAHQQALLQAAEERAESNFESSVKRRVTRSQGLILNWNPQMNQSPTVITETANSDQDVV